MIRLLIYVLVLTPVLTFAQTGLDTKSKKAIELYTEADNFRVRGQFEEAIANLNEAIEKDKKFTEAYYRLGVVYRMMNAHANAIKSFEHALTLTSDIRKQKNIWYDLGEAYLLSGQYEKATVTLTKFLNAETQNKQRINKANGWLQNAEFATKNLAVTSKYKQRVLSDTVNAFGMQYFPVLTADQQELIFTRRKSSNGQDYEDIVVSRKDASGRWLSPQSISPNINTPYNEGTCTISADGRKLIFTACEGRGYEGNCDLYESIKLGDQWADPVNLGPNVNSGDWESQPSLSADGRTLYFISDRKGGFGRRDIWFSIQDPKGEWSKARNLGKPINTEFEEYSPFIHANGRRLYYSTNGLVGFGGFDIYFSEKVENTWTPPVNVGSPINDNQDQYSLFITTDGVKGYYSHEEGFVLAHGKTKIFEVEIPDDQRITFKSSYVKGRIFNSKTNANLKARIELFDIRKNEIVSLVDSDSVSGEYLMVLTQGSEYALYVNKRGYLFKSLNFNYSEVKDFESLTIDISLDQASKGSVSVLKNIFFEVDKYDLQEKSITELEKIIRFLGENPTIKIEIGGHTDNTGNALYNQQLSEKRAKSVFSYLQSKGIEPKRLSSKGYGSAKPLSPNVTEEGRELNRRIEFTIQ